jgi:hypothetical protein
MRRRGFQSRKSRGRTPDAEDCGAPDCGALDCGASGKIRWFFPFDSLCWLRVRMTPSSLSASLSAKTGSLGCFRAVGLADGLFRGDDVFDDDAADAMPGHLGDLEATAFVLDALADGGDVA